MQSYISHPRGRVVNHLINLFNQNSALLIGYEKYRKLYKYDIFFDFRFTENMIFPSIAENSENMIFTLNVFPKMLFFMQCCYLQLFNCNAFSIIWDMKKYFVKLMSRLLHSTTHRLMWYFWVIIVNPFSFL